MSIGLRKSQSGADSPADTFIHSTITVPLKWAGFVGRRTRILVLYVAVVVVVTVHFPSLGMESALNAVAVPDAKYSCSS